MSETPSINTLIERALGAYLRSIEIEGVGLADLGGSFAGDPDLVPLAVHCICGELGPDGEIPEEWGKLPLPAVVVASPSFEPHTIGYDICSVSVIAITTPDEISAPAQVQRRKGWLAAAFDEDVLEDIAAALNDPDAPVQGLRVIGLERDGGDHAENGRQILCTLKLKVHAAPIPPG